MTAVPREDPPVEGLAFGPLLRTLRIAADLTLEQLAERSGVSDRAISDMERGVSQGPQARTVTAIAAALALSPEQHAALTGAARAGRRRGQPAAQGRCPLPRRVADFTGRRAELDSVRALVEAARAGLPAPVVLVSGAPGLGKTSLAVQAAAQTADAFPDGQFFLDLRGLDARPLTPTAVLDRLVHAVEPGAGPTPRDVDDAAALWRTVVGGRRILVLLDNAAHEGQVRPALPAEGPAAVVVTSRRTLGGLEGVHRLPLEPLPEAASVALLAGIVTHRTADADGLRQLARLCAHVPLALRIAGNRLASRPAWTAGDLVTRLSAHEHRLDALAVGDLQVKAAFALSYQQLSGIGRRLFRRLAAVPGPSTAVELAAVLVEETPARTEDALDELIDLGLLQQGGDGRFFLHDLLRLYAQGELEREESAQDRANADRRAADWLLDTTIVAGRWFEPAYGAPAPGATRYVELDSADTAREWLQAEGDNWLPALRRAAAEGAHQRVVDVAESLHWFSDLWAHWEHWAEVFALSSAAADGLGDDHLRAVHRGYLAWAYIYPRSEPEEGLRQAELAYEHARRAGDEDQQGWARFYCSYASARLGRFDVAMRHAQESVARFRSVRDWQGLPQSLVILGRTLRDAGRYEEALAAYAEVIEIVTTPETALPRHIVLISQLSAMQAMIELHGGLDQWQRMVELADEALRLNEELRHQKFTVAVLRLRATAHEGLGDRPAAAADLRATMRLQRELGDEAGQRETVQRLDALGASAP
ncbi:ATP-binding protein [Micromonospora haikouensis]|uniref:ATP-binding protein n=1 Tax=Micromonospora haikouensis TaxID=686309 RepID=UPI0036B83EBA